MAHKVDKEEVSIQRQRVQMLEREVNAKAYAHELQALRSTCHGLRKDVDERASTEEVSWLSLS